MKIVENNVKCGEIITLDHKFYFKKKHKISFRVCPCSGDFVKNFVLRVGFLNEQFSGPWVSPRETVTGKGDTCIMVSKNVFVMHTVCMHETSRDMKTVR